jgi:hypothetical protein
MFPRIPIISKDSINVRLSEIKELLIVNKNKLRNAK